MKKIVAILISVVFSHSVAYACEGDSYREYQYHLEPHIYEKCRDVKEEYEVVTAKLCIYGDFATINGIPQHVERSILTSPDGYCLNSVQVVEVYDDGQGIIRSLALLLPLLDIKEKKEIRERVVGQECRTVTEYPYVVRCGILP